MKTAASLLSMREEAGSIDLAEFERFDYDKLPSEEGVGDLMVVSCKGDSMEKLIMDGSRVVVDTSQRLIVSGSIYVLRVPWEGYIIRECYAEPERLVLRPYNKNYPVVRVGWEDFDPDIVVGKVYCSVINVFG